MANSTGADEVPFNVTENCFGKLRDIMRYAFDLSLQTAYFLIY